MAHRNSDSFSRDSYAMADDDLGESEYNLNLFDGMAKLDAEKSQANNSNATFATGSSVASKLMEVLLSLGCVFRPNKRQRSVFGLETKGKSQTKPAKRAKSIAGNDHPTSLQRFFHEYDDYPNKLGTVGSIKNDAVNAAKLEAEQFFPERQEKKVSVFQLRRPSKNKLPEIVRNSHVIEREYDYRPAIRPKDSFSLHANEDDEDDDWGRLMQMSKSIEHDKSQL